MSDRLYTVEMGRSGDVPLIFFHGFGAAAFVWADLQEDFADERLSLAYDLPGHGLSLDAEGIGGAGHMARAITADLARRGIDRVHLVGHSMGGAVATKIALRTPSVVASMTLLAPGAFGPEINHRLLHRFALATEHDALLAALENMYGWNSAVPERVVSGLVERRAVAGAPERLKTILGSIIVERDGGLIQGMISRRDLATLSMPVKVLWGTQDRVLPTRQAHRLPPLFAAHVFEDTGHMLIDERAGETARLIRQNIRAARD
jgi:pyruvate dehydrogenase E2 component (dihydrolipoamide acetyltransferase)